tara:strand:- start:3212 stop:4036 length:825 start_codon:yes stop_codon:yes gene_type:complete
MINKANVNNVLSIAGSDPSGGAGIQADLKAFSANRVYGMAVITALTAQNTQGVDGIYPIPADFISLQIQTILNDITVDAVKVGMTVNSEVSKAIGIKLKDSKIKNIVVDPVMVAKGGSHLLDESAIETIKEWLLPLATIITPNLPEAAVLLKKSPAKSKKEIMEQAKELLDLGPSAVLIKGGHLQGKKSPDLLLTSDSELWLDGERIDTKNTHGTGCTLSSTIAAYLARKLSIEEAVSDAKGYITGAIRYSSDITVGQGHGPTNHFFNIWKHLN